MILRRTLTLVERTHTSQEHPQIGTGIHLNASATIRDRILSAAEHLFAQNGYEKTTTRQLADAASISEGTLFRYFDHKKDILITLISQGWSLLLTDLLMELSEMPSNQAIASMLNHWLANFHQHTDLIRLSLVEVQYHPDLRDRIQQEIIQKMTSIAEAYIEDGIARGTYRGNLNPTWTAQIFLGLFMIAGFSPTLFQDTTVPPEAESAFANTLADIFLHGILVSSQQN
jgi:AcrR family transcriptional regulator